MRAFLLVLLCIFHASCNRLDPLPVVAARDRFKSEYSALSADYVIYKETEEIKKKLTLTADRVPLVTLLRTISDEANISVIAAKELDQEPISLEVKDVAIDQVLGAVARRLGQRLTRIGKIYYIGQISPEDRGVLVKRVRRLDAAGLKAVLDLFRSEFGHSETFSDGLVVVADRVEVLERVEGALSQIEQIESVTWVVQLYLVAMTDKFKSDLGIDLSNTVKFSWQVNTANGSSKAAVSGTLDALLVAAFNSPKARIVAEPLMLIRDGSTASLISGDNIPVPKKTVSAEGTVQTIGFENIQTGLTVKVGLRDETKQKSQAKFYIELSSITGYVEYSPIIKKQTIDTEVSVISGGVYLIGSLVDSQESVNLHGSVLPSIYSQEKDSSSVQVFAKVYRIGGDLQTKALADQSPGGKASSPAVQRKPFKMP